MATRRGKGRGNPGRTPQFTVPIKLWVTPEMYQELETMAEEHEWTVPHVIRSAVKEAQEKRSSR